MTASPEGSPVYGVIEDETLWHWLPEHEVLLTDIAQVAITKLDSTRDVGATSLPSFGFGRVVPYGDGQSALHATGNELIELARLEAFSGFDEVWICETRNGFAIPDGDFARSFSVIATLTPAEIRELANRMRRAGMAAVLGDGFGLSYLAVSETRAHALGLPVD
jgi:hypothetical protein